MTSLRVYPGQTDYLKCYRRKYHKSTSAASRQHVISNHQALFEINLGQEMTDRSPI